MRKHSKFHFIKIIMLGATFTFVMACSDREERSESPKMTAYRLIDEGHTDEAIVLLEQELAKDDKNLEIRLALSSAYAHKSGFRVQALVPLMKSSESLASFKDTPALPAGGGFSTTISKELSAALTMINKIVAQIQVYNSIPSLDANGEIFLLYALKLLNVPGITSREANYRLILRVVLMKYYVEKFVFGASQVDDKSESGSCEISPSKISEAVTVIGGLVSDILLDLSLTQPKEKEVFETKSRQVALNVDEINSYTTLLSASDGNSKALFGQVAKILGLKGVMVCE